MKKLETARKLARQTIEQGESSKLRKELHGEELLQQIEEMKLALEGVNQQFRENQKTFKSGLEEMERIMGNQQILHQKIQDL